MDNSTISDTYQLNWRGPFVLKGSQEKLLFDSPEANKSGIYIYAVEYRNGYMIYLAGMTGRTFKKRLKEEIAKYQEGNWTILNTKSFPAGKRDEIWHGIEWTGKEKEPERRAIFESCRQELNPEIENLLSTFRIFVSPLEAEKRVLARIEAAIMNILYSSEEPFRSFPDRGMSLAPLWSNEQPFTVKSIRGVHFHGLPQSFKA